MVKDALGEVTFPIVAKRSQRSLIAIKDIAQNEPLLENINFKSIRPGGGIESKDISIVQDRKATKAIKRGTLLSWKMIGGF